LSVGEGPKEILVFFGPMVDVAAITAYRIIGVCFMTEGAFFIFGKPGGGVCMYQEDEEQSDG
jgi:hypothetical protein